MKIHSTAIVENVQYLSNNIHIGAYAVVRNCILGDKVHIAEHVVIGGPPEHSTDKYEMNPGKQSGGNIVIGRGTVIREFTTINAPIATQTYIGKNVYIMGRCYIAHDCHIEDDVVLSNGTTLGGWTKVLKAANLGLNATVHQFSTIGQYAMIAANAAVVKDVPPLAKYIPGKPLGVNSYSIKKWELSVCDCGTHPCNEAYEELYVEWEKKRNPDRSKHIFEL